MMRQQTERASAGVVRNRWRAMGSSKALMLLAGWTLAAAMFVEAPARGQLVFPVPGGEDYAVELARNTLRIANAETHRNRFHAFLRSPDDPAYQVKQDMAFKGKIRQLDEMIEMFSAQGYALRQELPRKQLFQLGSDIREINEAVGDLEKLISGDLKELSPRLKDVHSKILEVYRMRKAK